MRPQKLYSTVLLLAFFAFTSMQAYSQGSAKSFDVEYTIKLTDFNKGARELFVNTYFKEVMEGKREALNWRETGKKISADEISELAMRNDTFYIENPEPPYNLEMQVIEAKADPMAAITQVFVKEKWTLAANGDVQKKILEISPAIENKFLCNIKL